MSRNWQVSLKTGLAPVMMVVCICGGMVLDAEPALAYIGPGVGISMLGALWAVIATIFVALMGIVLWPLRAMLKRRKANKQSEEQEDYRA